jgi:hypothetical protein
MKYVYQVEYYHAGWIAGRIFSSLTKALRVVPKKFKGQRYRIIRHYINKGSYSIAWDIQEKN